MNCEHPISPLYQQTERWKVIEKKKQTIKCLVLKRQLVVLEVVIIFSSRSKKLLKDDQDMVVFTGKRKTLLALYKNQF